MSESTQDYTLVCLSEAASPITHASGVAGNVSLVARETVSTPSGVRWLPFLSGNAVRHRCIREPGMHWLVEEYGLAGTLTLPQLNFLFNGGNLTEGGGREDTNRIADFQRLWPLGRLLGGCLPDQILAGSLQVWRGALVCEENRAYLSAVLPDPSALPDRMRPAESFVSGYQYTRGDAAKTGASLLIPAPDGASAPDSNLMIFSGQSVMRGAAFVHGFTLPRVSRIELGSLAWSLRLWQAAGGTIGGQASRGHGRLITAIVAGVDDPDGAAVEYVDYTRSVKADAVAWLRGVFAPKPEKAAKPVKEPKGKKSAPVAAPEADLFASSEAEGGDGGA